MPTYRGPGGLWNDPDTARLSDLKGLKADPDACWKFWGDVRRKAAEAEPNQAHQALAQWQKNLSNGQSFTLITQNVDELHQRAGSKNVVELHGSLFTTRCSNEKCPLEPYRDHDQYPLESPKCSLCNQYLRPGIILFEEALPPDAEWQAK
ncbi:MAG: NAD-dependent protein deacylase, partial [Candidatus Obscuribacterales bacterium]|nr:NAD-dependent protein deacylase [Candidatus Obscuribacterales bacterium]